MKVSFSLMAVLVFGLVGPCIPAGAQSVSEEVSFGFLPLDWVTATFKKTLSPEGRYKFAGLAGPVRVSDRPEKIADARRALEALQKAPATVPIDLSFISITSRLVPRAPASAPAQRDGIPVPSHYTAPRIMAGPGGSVIAIPSQPIFKSGPKAPPQPSTQPAERRSETSVTRRFSASAAAGKPLTLAVLGQVADVAALRALALKLGAIGQAEPAWTRAGTELVIQSEFSGGVLLLKIVPQIVLPAAAPGEPARRIALMSCAGGVQITRGGPMNTGTLPNTDAQFYRLFLGAPQLEKDSLNALRVSAAVHYLGDPLK